MSRFDRRAFLGASAAAALGSTTPVSSTITSETATDGEATAPDPWAQYRVDAANTGSASTEGPREYLEEGWANERRDRGGDIGWFGISSHPALVDGTLYVTSLEGDLGDGETWIHSIDASDGTENWRFEDRAFRQVSTPAVSNGRVLVGGNEYADGLLALDAADGTERWRADRNALGSPTVLDGEVYVSSGGPDGGGEVAVLDVSDGSLKRSVDPTADGTDWLSARTGAAVDDTVYVRADVDDGTGTERGVLYAVAAETGERRFTVEHDGVPMVDHGTVYVSDDTELYAFDATTGDRQWSKSGMSESVLPTVADGTVYAAADGERELVALDAETGEERWRSNVSEEMPDGEDVDPNVIFSDIVLADDTLYFGTADRGMWTVDATDGTLLDNVLGGRGTLVSAPPAVADGTAYVGSFEAATGLFAVEEGDPPAESEPPAPEVELRIPEDSPYCVGQPIAFVREVTAPLQDYDYTWRMDFATGDDEAGAYEAVPDDAGVGRLVRHTYEPGTYEAALTVKAPDGRTETATRTVEVDGCPTARIETDPSNAGERDLERGTTITLDASSSSDPDGEIVSYEWDVGGNDEFERSGATIEVDLDVCGQLPVRVRVTDDAGLTDTTETWLSTVE